MYVRFYQLGKACDYLFFSNDWYVCETGRQGHHSLTQWK
jgi:hypothetical protein